MIFRPFSRAATSCVHPLCPKPVPSWVLPIFSNNAANREQIVDTLGRKRWSSITNIRTHREENPPSSYPPQRLKISNIYGKEMWREPLCWRSSQLWCLPTSFISTSLWRKQEKSTSLLRRNNRDAVYVAISSKKQWVRLAYPLQS